MGLSAGSAAPSWRDASFALVLLSALYMVLAAIASYGFGGYVSGLLREPMTAPADEIEFRDGMHGLLVWGLATAHPDRTIFDAVGRSGGWFCRAGNIGRRRKYHCL